MTPIITKSGKHGFQGRVQERFSSLGEYSLENW